MSSRKSSTASTSNPNNHHHHNTDTINLEETVSSAFNIAGKPIMDLSELRMGRDATQQSIIWNEITAARRKLEEENQMLRDKLYEAQMANRMLRLKLKQSQTGANIDKELKLLANESTMFQKFFRSRKDAFRNPAAPGKKIFRVPHKNSTTEVTSHKSGSDKTPPTVISIPVLPVSPLLESPVSDDAQPKQHQSQPTSTRTSPNYTSIRRQPTTDSTTTAPRSNHNNKNYSSKHRGTQLLEAHEELDESGTGSISCREEVVTGSILQRLAGTVINESGVPVSPRTRKLVCQD